LNENLTENTLIMLSYLWGALLVLAVAIPGKAAGQYTGGNQTWFHSMLYASWTL